VAGLLPVFAVEDAVDQKLMLLWSKAFIYFRHEYAKELLFSMILPDLLLCPEAGNVLESLQLH
jgi:hypothetical protein